AAAAAANRGDEDRQVSPGAANRRELFPAARHRAGKAHGIQNPVAQRGTSTPLLHLISFGRETARAEESLEEREGRVQAKVGARRLAHRLHVVANEDGKPHGNIDLAEAGRLGATAVDPY